MENITVKDIVDMTGGVLLCGEPDTCLTDICTDSRQVKEGDLFVPIIGANLDGHRYIKKALETGSATLTSKREEASGKPYIFVEDTEKALQEIGRGIRTRLIDIPVVAVTGSVGKTTTREMIAKALSAGKRTFQTQKNFNSQIGVPITLSRMSKEDEIAVVEMGISEDGQMDILSELVRPDMAVVTTIGDAHIEFMKTRENIRHQKLSIVHFMKEGGTLFLNGDDLLLKDARETEHLTCQTIFYGTQNWCDYYAKDIVCHDFGTTFTCVHGNEEVQVVLGTYGKHNVGNCVAALAVANENGIPMEQAAGQFKDFQGQRLNILRLEHKYTIINDAYNASPDSMKASISVLCEMPCTGRRIAVLGDMFELGENEVEYHKEVGRFLLGTNVDEVIVLGDLAQNIKNVIEESDSRIKVYTFSEKEEAAIYIMATLRPEDLVLVKASNGMKLGELVDILKA